MIKDQALNDLNNDPLPPYTRKTAATALGCGTCMLDRLIKAGKLHAYKIGKKVVIPRESLEDYRRANAVKVVE